MIQDLHPPGFDLPDEASVRWSSFTKFVRAPEHNWPAQILERPIIVGKIGRTSMALIADPEAAKTVLTGSPERFPKWKIYDRVLAGGFGTQNLGVVEGEQHHHQRRMLAPMFRPHRQSEAAAVFRAATERACEEWLGRGDEIRIDAGLEMGRITLASIWVSMFGDDPAANSPPSVERAARRIDAAHTHSRVEEPPECFAELAAEARSDPHGAGVLAPNPFSRLGAPGSEDAADSLSQAELFDNARLFLAAGSETTATALTWALWLLGQSPEIQRRVQAELDQVFAGGPSASELPERCVFTRQVVSETLRLYPPSVATVRQARSEEVLAGETVPAGCILVVSLYALHRHALLWDAPRAFRPDRFGPGSGEPRHPFAFLPFSAGAHACIGSQFAWTEAITVLATILRRFDVVSDSSAPIRPRTMIALLPDREISLQLRPRRRQGPG